MPGGDVEAHMVEGWWGLVKSMRAVFGSTDLGHEKKARAYLGTRSGWAPFPPGTSTVASSYLSLKNTSFHVESDEGHLNFTVHMLSDSNDSISFHRR
jgi:hypothetical protein